LFAQAVRTACYLKAAVPGDAVGIFTELFST
jgi:hypothetical protein